MKKSRNTRSPRAKRADKTSPKRADKTPLFWAGIALIAAAIIIALIVIFWPQGGNDAVVTVNGEPILQEEVDFQYNLLPAAYQQTFTREQVLEQIIDEELVVQAAVAKGITVSDEEVLKRIQAIIAENQISLSEFQENLAQYNVTQERFEELIRRQQLIDAYLNMTLTPSPADETTLEALYNVSKSQFSVDEQVTVRHVLISNQRDDAAVIAKQVYDEAQAGEDFCTLVTNYSDDRGSRDSCGEYTFPRGFMDPAFENASFGIADGEFVLVQTQFGYHVINRINMTPAYTQTFEEVRPQLESQYAAADRSMQYRKILSTLRSQATIIYANGTKIVPEQPTTVSPTGNAVETPGETLNETNDTIIIVPESPADETPAEQPADEAEVPAEEIPAETPPTVSSDELMACIASRAKLYGASWSTETQDALRLFSRNGITLDYTECNAQGASCAGIEAYPTWVIGGQEYLGRMSLEQLKNAAGC